MNDEELLAFSGIPLTPENKTRAEQALTMSSALVGAYCRGREINRAGKLRPGVQAVIDSAAARILANPSQIAIREQIGPYSLYKQEGFKGFTLVELTVLNRYRKRGV